MLLNDNRGSMGMFSRAGRNSADKFHILMRRDEILFAFNKKTKIQNLFSPDEGVIKTNLDEEEIDIFKTEEKEKGKDKNQSEVIMKKTVKEKVKKEKPKSEIAGYLKMKKKGKKKADNPTCTKYNPKHEFVWKKTAYSGPHWGQSVRKFFSIKPKEEADAKFYRSHTDFKIHGKNFVDLSKQTKRPSFIGEKLLNENKNASKDYSPESIYDDSRVTTQQITLSQFYGNKTNTKFNKTERNFKNFKDRKDFIENEKKMNKTHT